MKFYRLTHPRYLTDREQCLQNPIRMISEFYVPGIMCPACADATGGGWASSDRVRVEVPKSSPLLPYLARAKLGIAEWTTASERIRTELGVPSWMPITPGAQLGLPTGELTAACVPDVMHPFPGQLIVREQVVTAIERSRLSGTYPLRVELIWAKHVARDEGEVPSLYELLIAGRAWRKGSDEATVTACSQCGRTIFPNPDYFVVDENRWDGSDFFHVDKNPNIVMVTERVCQMLGEWRFDNWVCLHVA